jgi:hypothetical protein
MNNPLTGRPMSGFFIFLEGNVDWDLWLEKVIKKYPQKIADLLRQKSRGNS